MELANSIITLQPGMYILRHPQTGMPALSVSRAATNPGHTGRIEALYTPNTHGGVLRTGKDCIVMQVLDGPADLLVTAYLERAGAAVPALKVDKIKLDDEPTSVAIPAHGISLVGHIERVGDAIAATGTPLGDPSGERRLEGFQVMWPDKPANVDVMYSAQIEGAGESPEVGTGRFCGTRNAARSITGVKFTLAGEGAAGYELAGEARFAGGHNAPIQSGAMVAGPSGAEHLTTLQLRVEKKGAAGKQAKNNPWEASPRTRVMKARGKK
jgi:hypothetical protein